MRLAAYAGTSVALAAAILLKALHSRPNFYSVCVYFAESNAALMILSNLVLLVVGTLLVGLQHILYGPLRAIEIEQLYEKAWFAVTETCLAMTIFREELGVWFVVMFVSLLVAKVWGWIGEGRLEILEQQPPENPRLFHARLSTSLVLSMVLNVWLLSYSIDTVRQTNRPNMMVMFAFEFALLNVSSLSTLVRYGITVQEALIVREQTNAALQIRRKEIEEQRKTAREAAQVAGEPAPEEPPIEEVLEEVDIDVPGWEEKSRWIFYLDLTTDFLRLLLYITFFFVLCRLYGMPIHIIRDVALVVRSFYRRVTDFIKYRHATRDMHARYPDATAEEIASQDVCIICREGMTARAPDTAQAQAQESSSPRSSSDERLRPKKLPCGHVLHFACLRSWLERQQNCPTCRQPVLSSSQPTQSGPGTNPPANNPAGDAQQPADENPPQQPNPGQANARLNRMRTFNLGPLRLTLATGHIVQAPPAPHPTAPQQPPATNEGPRVRELRERLGDLDARVADVQAQTRQREQARQTADSTAPLQPTSRSRNTPTLNGVPDSNTAAIQSSLNHLERMIMQDAMRLRHQTDQLNMLRSMQTELHRLRATSVINPIPTTGVAPTIHPIPVLPSVSAFNVNSSTEPIQSGNTNLPTGVTIPEGWSLLTLQRVPDHNPTFGFTGGLPLNPEQQRSRSLGPSGRNIPSTHMHPGPSNLPSVSVQSPNISFTTSVLQPSASTANSGPTQAPEVGAPAQERFSGTTAAIIDRLSVQDPTQRQQASSSTGPETTAPGDSAPLAAETETSRANGWQWPTSPPIDTPGSVMSPSSSVTRAETNSGQVDGHARVATVEDAPSEEE